MENLVRKILPKDHLDGATVNKCAAIAKEEYARRWFCNSKPYSGIPELLIALEKRGIANAVLSNKPDEFTKIMVEKLLPDRNFEIVRGALPNVPIKPNPAAALEIAKEMSIPPESFICLGDSNVDMQTANLAGMYAVGVLWGFRDAEELLTSGAKVLVETPMDVLKLLKTTD